MDKLHEMQKLIRRIDFRIEILKKKRKSITCDMMYEIVGAEAVFDNHSKFVKSQYYKNVPTGIPADETIKNCDLS